MKFYVLILMVLVQFLSLSCGKKVSEYSQDGRILSAEVSMVNNDLIKVYVGGNYHHYNFDVRVDEEQSAFAVHNGEKVGSLRCLEEVDEICIRKQYNLDFYDRGVHFVTVVDVEEQLEPLKVSYFEQEKGDETSREYFDFAEARYVKLVVGNSVNHNLVLAKYHYEKEVRDQVFMKKFDFANDSNVSFAVIGKLPRTTTRDESVFTDMYRDGYRSKQNPDLRTVNYYGYDDEIFMGTEAKDEWDHFFDDDNRDVGLIVSGLTDLLEKSN